MVGAISHLMFLNAGTTDLLTIENQKVNEYDYEKP